MKKESMSSDKGLREVFDLGVDELSRVEIEEKGASILLSVIGDIRDSSDGGRLASYFGIVPRISNSNETQRSGRITKRGSKLGRTTLIQCTLRHGIVHILISIIHGSRR